MRSKSFAERIADVLIEDGLLLPSQLEEAVLVQQKQGGRLLKILTEKQFVTDQDMTVSMGRCLNTPLINLSKLRVPEEIMSLVPKELAKANKLVPIARLNGKLFVAMADPTNVLAVDDVKRRVGATRDTLDRRLVAPHAHDLLPPVGERLGQSESGLQAALIQGLDDVQQFRDPVPARLLGEGLQAEQSADFFLHLVDRC